MPTGYTCKIEEGCTFPEFAWSCARAFGALIEMKDDPADAPIPEEFRPSPYYQDRVNELRDELAELDRMTMDDVVRRIADERAEVERDNEEYREKHRDKMTKYAAMQREVEAWKPPTPDHENLKRFMIDQIRQSVEWERGDPYQRELPVESPAKWLAENRESLTEDLESAMKGLRAEIARTASRNEWVRKLRGSLPTGKPGSWRDRSPLA